MDRKTDMSKAVELHIAENGFSCITTFSMWHSMRLRLLLRFRYGFKRHWPWMPAITDQAIHPDFVRGKEIIKAGWDHWYGYELLADNKETDIFLKGFHARHCKV